MFLKYRMATLERKRFLSELKLHAFAAQGDQLSVKQTSSSKSLGADYAALYFFLPFVVSGAFYVYSFKQSLALSMQL